MKSQKATTWSRSSLLSVTASREKNVIKMKLREDVALLLLLMLKLYAIDPDLEETIAEVVLQLVLG